MFAGFSCCVTQAKSWVSSLGFLRSLGALLVSGDTMSSDKEQAAPLPIYGKKPSLLVAGEPLVVIKRVRFDEFFRLGILGSTI
jgi:hypothetical protein